MYNMQMFSSLHSNSEIEITYLYYWMFSCLHTGCEIATCIELTCNYRCFLVYILVLRQRLDLLVLMDVFWSTYWFRDRYKEVMSMFVDG